MKQWPSSRKWERRDEEWYVCVCVCTTVCDVLCVSGQWCFNAPALRLLFAFNNTTVCETTASSLFLFSSDFHSLLAPHTKNVMPPCYPPFTHIPLLRLLLPTCCCRSLVPCSSVSGLFPCLLLLDVFFCLLPFVFLFCCILCPPPPSPEFLPLTHTQIHTQSEATAPSL